jgi:Icc-related predicted phosphoesterase
MDIQRIVCISDTHGKHAQLALPEGDLLLHAGDISSTGQAIQIKSFMDWFGAQPHRYKVMIAGNHDFLAEDQPKAFLEMVPDNVVYLNDSGVTIEGLHIWGSPVQPWFHDWAFNRKRGPKIAEHWAKIPDQVDILITHGPPFGVGDMLSTGPRVGCEDLKIRVDAVRPKLHVFGHIHEAYGIYDREGICYVNASVLNLQYQQTQAPIVIEWPLVEPNFQ